MDAKKQARSVAADKLPVLFRHMVVAIFDKQRGEESKRFAEAVAIARWSLVESDYMSPQSTEGWVGDMLLTSKGRKRDAEHRSESGRAVKESKFKKLYDKHRHLIEPAVTRSEEESARKRQ